jgi:hypothetical protein
MQASDEMFVAQQFLEGAVFVHFLEDVAASDQLAIYVELRVGGPL